MFISNFPMIGGRSCERDWVPREQTQAVYSLGIFAIDLKQVTVLKTISLTIAG